MESSVDGTMLLVQMDHDAHAVQITRGNAALARLKLSWETVEFSAEDAIGPLESLHQAGDMVVAAVRMDEAGTTVLGSGVMVGPGLLLPASHVLDEFPREGSVTNYGDTRRARSSAEIGRSTSRFTR